MCEILRDCSIGIVAGVVSSLIVYYGTKRRERKQAAYQYWFNYILGAYRYCDMYFPVEETQWSWLFRNEPDLKDAIFEIQGALQVKEFPKSVEDRDLSDEEIAFTENCEKAMKLLLQWGNKNL